MYTLSQGNTNLRKKQRLSTVISFVALTGWIMLALLIFDAIIMDSKLLIGLL